MLLTNELWLTASQILKSTMRHRWLGMVTQVRTKNLNLKFKCVILISTLIKFYVKFAGTQGGTFTPQRENPFMQSERRSRQRWNSETSGSSYESVRSNLPFDDNESYNNEDITTPLLRVSDNHSINGMTFFDSLFVFCIVVLFFLFWKFLGTLFISSLHLFLYHRVPSLIRNTYFIVL